MADVRRPLLESRSREELHVFDNGICISCADDEPDGPMDEDAQALLAAIAELGAATRAAFVSGDHPRNPKGVGGGRFRSNVDKLKDAIKAHKASGGKGADPFAGFDREQLRRVAKARGIELKRGESQDSIAAKLRAHLDNDEPAAKPAEVKPDVEVKPEPKPEPKKRAPRKKAAPKAAKPPEKPASAGGRVRGRDLTGTPGLAADVAKRSPSFHSKEKGLAAIASLQGFDGKAEVVSKADLDARIAAGDRELYRGVENGGDLTAAEINEQFRSGRMFYGTGYYGHGVYTGTYDHAEDFAEDYGRAPGAIVRMALSRDARVIDYAEFMSGWTEHRESFPAGSPDYELWSDPSRYAAALGYDAVVGNMEGSIVILNRTALTFEAAA